MGNSEYILMMSFFDCLDLSTVIQETETHLLACVCEGISGEN